MSALLQEAEYTGKYLSDDELRWWVLGLTEDEADQINEWLAAGRESRLLSALRSIQTALQSILVAIEALQQIAVLWQDMFIVTMRRLTLTRQLSRYRVPMSVSNWIAWRWPARWLPGWGASP